MRLSCMSCRHWQWISLYIVKVVCGSTATLASLWRNSWSITGHNWSQFVNSHTFVWLRSLSRTTFFCCRWSIIKLKFVFSGDTAIVLRYLGEFLGGFQKLLEGMKLLILMHSLFCTCLHWVFLNYFYYLHFHCHSHCLH